ncbi:hypothetical protein [Actinokineospora inagensis]|uniref:hypothetical protein n=1 Tax=Actinokineospora inagensis TaxID=103730 RepID=UPI00047BE572|nr:hypothetical protein [Actinokineospora inagensis]
MRVAATLVTAAALFVTAAPAANAYQPVEVVHTEQVKAGPYSIVVGFSTWPVRAMQSLDFTFDPDGGVAGKSGTLVVTPLSQPDQAWDEPLARHPRKREVWGLDVRSLPDPGDYRLQFVVDGPQGHGDGELPRLHVLDQPGPPMALSWSISALPALGLGAFLVVAWRRTRRRLVEVPA